MKSNKKITIISVLFFLVFINIFQSPVRSFFYNFSSPIQEFFWEKGQGFFTFSDTIIKITSFKEEMENLKQENRELRLENIFLQELKKENEVLKKALEIELKKEFDLSFVRVIGLEKDCLFINQGKNQGIKENSLVITKDKVLIGKVSEVFSNQSRVMTLSNKESTINAEILEKNISGLIKGEGNSRMVLEFVSFDKEVEENDFIISNDFLIGKVTEIIKKDAESFLEIKVKPAFNSRELNYLFIIND